jgi:tetratricopeptide (TPR) repeat protein
MILYKYFPPDRVDVLRNGMIRFTPPAALNDPFDCSPRYLTKDELEDAPESEVCPGCAQVYVQGLQLALSSEDRQSVGLVCLSEKPDSLLMWAHYAECHRGYVLGFDTTQPFFSKSSDGTGLWKVSYADRRPSLPKDIVELELSRQPKLNPLGLHVLVVGSDTFNPDTDANDYRFVKSTEWEYEQEWRLLRKLENPSRIIEMPGAFPIYLYQFPKSIVHSVIIGFRGYSSLCPDIRQVIQEDPDYSHVKLLRTLKDGNNFRVEIVELQPSKSVEVAQQLDTHSTARLLISVDEDTPPAAHTCDPKTGTSAQGGMDSSSEPRIAQAIDLLDDSLQKWGSRDQVLELLRLQREIRKAVAEKREDAGLYDRLGLLLGALGRYPEALQSFEAALRCDPKRSDVWYSLGCLYSGLKDGFHAEAAYRKVLELQPQFAMARTNLGICLMLQGNRSEAERCFRIAMRDDPTLFEPHINLATVLIQLDKHEEALAELFSGIRLQSRPGSAPYLCIARLLSCLNENGPRKERMLAELVGKLNAGQELGMLAFALRICGLSNEAIPLLQKQVQLCPTVAMPLLDLAAIWKYHGDTEKAEECLRRALPLIAADDWYSLACFSAISGNADRCFDCLKQIQSSIEGSWVQDDPNFEDLRDDPRMASLRNHLERLERTTSRWQKQAVNSLLAGTWVGGTWVGRTWRYT